MRPVAFYLFEHTPPGARRPKRTTYRMTIEEAAERLPGAVPLEWSKEVRQLPEGDDLVSGGFGFLATSATGFVPTSPQTQKAPSPPKQEGEQHGNCKKP